MIGSSTVRRAVTRLVDKNGQTCTVRQSTQTRGLDGSAVLAWADAVDSNGETLVEVKVILEPISSGAAQRIWGLTTEARLRGWVPINIEIVQKQGLIVTAGDARFVGRRFSVVECDPYAIGQTRILGLKETPELFA
jgi:hypothetical protein